MLETPHVNMSVKGPTDLTGVAQGVGCHPADQKVTNLIPSQGTCLDRGFGPQLERVWEATDQCFSLTLMFLSLSFCLPFPLPPPASTPQKSSWAPSQWPASTASHVRHLGHPVCPTFRCLQPLLSFDWLQLRDRFQARATQASHSWLRKSWAK